MNKYSAVQKKFAHPNFAFRKKAVTQSVFLIHSCHQINLYHTTILYIFMLKAIISCKASCEASKLTTRIRHVHCIHVVLHTFGVATVPKMADSEL